MSIYNETNNEVKNREYYSYLEAMDDFGKLDQLNSVIHTMIYKTMKEHPDIEHLVKLLCACIDQTRLDCPRQEHMLLEFKEAVLSYYDTAVPSNEDYLSDLDGNYHDIFTTALNMLEEQEEA